MTRKYQEKKVRAWVCLLKNLELTREPPQLIHADFVHILSIYRGHHAKKKPKRIWAHAISFEGYRHFPDFSAYGKGVYVKID